MDSLTYIKKARSYETLKEADFSSRVRVNLMTNFTDGILKDIFVGAMLSEGIYPVVHQVPYRQYHLALQGDSPELHEQQPDVTLIFFDANSFKESEFHSPDHFDDVLLNIERFAKTTKGIVIFNNFLLPYRGSHGNLFHNNNLFKTVKAYNEKIDALAESLSNVFVLDMNRLAYFAGEQNVFDSRGLYAFDIPFTQEFMTLIVEEWVALLRARSGGSKKCIVLDLDNTLWGGVLGESGPQGIVLGPEYPGNAFMNFQRALLGFYNRGIILAINSKNNLSEVLEVFEKNPHMILKKDHFAGIRANWEDKSKNLMDLADELNIGLDAMMFLDDDPMQRDLVRLNLPQVRVPEFSLPPEEYAGKLYSFNDFHQFAITDEDLAKGKMYVEERERKELRHEVVDLATYISELKITVAMRLNALDSIPRISQLTMKTNQFNITTHRYTEHDITQMVQRGALVYSANVTDKFGDYGMVLLAIAVPGEDGMVALDTFLMSCRVMGRGVEYAALQYVVDDLARRGFAKITAEFIPTAKNKPAETFLADYGFSGDGNRFELDLSVPEKLPCPAIAKSIIITSEEQ